MSSPTTTLYGAMDICNGSIESQKTSVSGRKRTIDDVKNDDSPSTSMQTIQEKQQLDPQLRGSNLDDTSKELMNRRAHTQAKPGPINDQLRKIDDENHRLEVEPNQSKYNGFLSTINTVDTKPIDHPKSALERDMDARKVASEVLLSLMNKSPEGDVSLLPQDESEPNGWRVYQGLEPQKEPEQVKIGLQQPQILPESNSPIASPNINDVLCRVGNIKNHSGNVQFRDIIKSHKKVYLKSKKLVKIQIAAAIVNSIRTMNPPGRFLKKKEGTGIWYDIGDEEAIKKTGQALRQVRGAASTKDAVVKSTPFGLITITEDYCDIAPAPVALLPILPNTTTDNSNWPLSTAEKRRRRTRKLPLNKKKTCAITTDFAELERYDTRKLPLNKNKMCAITTDFAELERIGRVGMKPESSKKMEFAKSSKKMEFAKSYKKMDSTELERYKEKCRQEVERLQPKPTPISIDPTLVTTHCENANDKTQWLEMVEQLKDFIKKHGHGKVPNFYRQNVALAQWARKQRRELCGISTNEEIRARYELLVDVGFSFDVVGTKDELWNRHLQDLISFVEEHGHGEVPTDYPPNQDLAKWSKRQRYHYKVYLKNMREFETVKENPKMMRCQMTPDRLALLTDAGFAFDPYSSRWERQLNIFKKGDPNIQLDVETIRSFQKWFFTQRYVFKLMSKSKKNPTQTQRLDPGRVKKLTEAGFPLTGKIPSWLNELFDRLKYNEIEQTPKPIPEVSPVLLAMARDHILIEKARSGAMNDGDSKEEKTESNSAEDPSSPSKKSCDIAPKPMNEGDSKEEKTESGSLSIANRIENLENAAKYIEKSQNTARETTGGESPKIQQEIDADKS